MILSAEEMQAIVSVAHKLGRKVAPHAHDASGIKLAKEKSSYLVMDIYNDGYILGEGEKAGLLPESLASSFNTW